MHAKTVIEKFGFRVNEEPKSIYPFSPVYRIKNAKRDFIIKKTQHPMLKAERLMKYITRLSERGVRIVVPVALPVENPMSIHEDTYVVYPFIDGAGYTGKDWEIEEAGRMLGRIHSLSSLTNEYKLDSYDVFDFNEAEVKESVAHILEHAKIWKIKIGIELEVQLMQSVHSQDELKSTSLPHVATPHDFKANNLIYTPEPYLVDPDNACWIPRVFDLALVLLLFHNELDTAPDQPFSSKQWNLFLTGYNEFVILTPEEEKYWQKAVEHVFLDEVMWLMADVPDDWDNPAQRNLFNGLFGLMQNLDAYSIAEQ